MLILNFREMVRTRGSYIDGRGRRCGRDRGRGRGRGRGVQANRAELVELANDSTRDRASPSSLASVDNDRNEIRNVRMDSQ